MVNKVILLGALGADPEVRIATGSIKVARLRLATSETFKDKTTGEKKTTTEWHTVVLWRQVAEIAEKYLKKGSMAYIEGKLSTREWTDKDGNKRYSTEVVADTLRLMPGRNDEKKEHPTVAPEPGPAPEPAREPAEAPDDFPF